MLVVATAWLRNSQWKDETARLREEEAEELVGLLHLPLLEGGYSALSSHYYSDLYGKATVSEGERLSERVGGGTGGRSNLRGTSAAWAGMGPAGLISCSCTLVGRPPHCIQSFQVTIICPQS